MSQPVGAIDLMNHSGGMITEVVDSLMPDGSYRLIMNLDDDIVGGLRVRRGESAVGSQVQDNKVCLGLYNFRDSGSGTDNQLIAVFNDSGDSNAVTSYLDGGSWSAISGGSSFTADAKFRFTTFLDYVFMVNSANDAIKSWDGNTGNSWGTTNLTSAPSGKFIDVYKDRVLVAGTTANPDRVYKSSLPSSGTISWDTTNDWVDVNPEDGQNITALANNGTYELIWKERAFYRWNGKALEPDLIYDIGCTSQESVATRNGVTFFFNPYGIYITNGGRPQVISRPIQRWIDAISGSYFTEVSGAVDEDNYYCSIGDVTVDGESFTNVVLVYSISRQRWRIYTYGEEIRYMARYTDSSGLFAIVAGNDDGDVWQLNNGTTDAAGNAISFDLRTPKLHFGSFVKEKTMTDLFCFAENMPGAKTFVTTDKQAITQTLEMKSTFTAREQGLSIEGRYFEMALRGAAQGTRGLFHGWALNDLSIDSDG